MTTNTHIAAQARKAALYLSSSALNMDRHAGEILLQCAQALEAAPALDAQGERSGFPPRIMKLLLEVAEREGKGSRGPWEDGDGEPLQEDADAAISWIDHMAATPSQSAVQPLSEAQAFAISAPIFGGGNRYPSAELKLVRAIERAHGIVTKESST